MRLHQLPAALLLLTTAALAQTPRPDALTQWRAAYAAGLAQPDGWLALVALQWLQDGDTSVGSAPGNQLVLPHTPAHLGIFRQHSGRIEFLAPPEGVSQSVLLDGKPAAGATGLHDLPALIHPSTISNWHRVPRFIAAPSSSTRSDCAVRPCFPIIFPISSHETFSRSTITPPDSHASTRISFVSSISNRTIPSNNSRISSACSLTTHAGRRTGTSHPTRPPHPLCHPTRCLGSSSRDTTQPTPHTSLICLRFFTGHGDFRRRKLFFAKTTQNQRVKPPTTPKNAKHPVNSDDFNSKIVAYFPAPLDKMEIDARHRSPEHSREHRACRSINAPSPGSFTLNSIVSYGYP